MRNSVEQIRKSSFILLLYMLYGVLVFAQEQKSTIVRGVVLDAQNEPVIGATVKVKDIPTLGTVTDVNGAFSLDLKKSTGVIVVSYIGMTAQEVNASGQKSLKIVLLDDNLQLNEVIVVGYGQQKKESVVGSIAQTSGKILQRTGGVTNVGAALTGNIPGVITVQDKGTPGNEDPTIYIRGQSTWNNSSPLILIDGIERPLSGLDVNSIENISVLKDASATAVFGVKGANGVILVTTKRGMEGKANIQVGANATVKFPAKLPEKYDSYDSHLIGNEAIEREMVLFPDVWSKYTPFAEIQKYRYPSSLEEAERYPNVDWTKELIKDYTMSYNANASISGGTSFVKYYSAIDWTSEGDLFKIRDTDQNYKKGYGYNRINLRCNLDFNLTSTTKLSLNMAGNYSIRRQTENTDFESRIWQAIYGMAPDVMLPIYSDGSWGYYPNDQVDVINSSRELAHGGSYHIKTTQIQSDVILAQDLSMLLKGLSVKGSFSMDNVFVATGGVSDGGYVQKWISPDGQLYMGSVLGSNDYDYVVGLWSPKSESMDNKKMARKTFYQLQMNYTRKFGMHNVGAMGLFSREEKATGSEFPYYREDWVFRATYDYASRYFFETNGSYNGSEKFGPGYRFQFFPSVALGWMVSEEKIMKKLKWLDMLKLRASIGQVGDDSGSGRFLYMTQWAYGSQVPMGSVHSDNSPYKWYKESSIGNPEIRWETVTKKNFGVDFAFLGGLLSGSLDVFNDRRKDILLAGTARSIPAYFGAVPATTNLGEVKVAGYELELRSTHTFRNSFRLWGNLNITHAKDEVIFADDPQLLPDYQKKQGYQIGQVTTTIRDDYYNTWDELYASTPLDAYDKEKLPGNWNLIDFNGDGVIDKDDNVPYSYPERPQNTYNYTLGFEYKGFSGFVQFYGVNNVSRWASRPNGFVNGMVVSKEGTYWSKDNVNADRPLPHVKANSPLGDYYRADGSYLRLKTAELAYTFTGRWIESIGVKTARLYVNGNNLIFWSKLPDDRERGDGGYPTMKRVNFGVNFTF